jgi:anthranilate phosphoribosyltransferase
MHDYLRTLVSGESLSREQSGEMFRTILSGEAEPAQIAAALALIQSRGVTTQELIGAATVMREHVTPVPVRESFRSRLVDTCGTGGAPKTFNVSTAAAIIAAAAGNADGERRLLVAKHGNRSRTGRGSAEVLRQLGINIDATPEQQARCLEEAGICFCFAIHHHPAMRHAAGPRKALGFPTVFNLLGPLTNPAGAQRQLLGVYDAERLGPVAETLAALGTERAMVVRGDDGLDEITTTTTTTIAHVREGAVEIEHFDPRSVGIERAELADLQAGDLEEAAGVIRSILEGEPGPKADIALLNAAATLVVGGVVETIAEGVERARQAVSDASAACTLQQLSATSLSADNAI